MPGRDQTGPTGMGPLTGRGMGPCAGYAGYPAGGRFGFGRGGFGGGRGWRNRYYATGLTGWQRAAMGQPAFGGQVPFGDDAMDPQQELSALKQQADHLAAALETVQNRIEQLQDTPQE